MSGHTPGPWTVFVDERVEDGLTYVTGYNIESANGEIVGIEGIESWKDGAEANARLIAAAPILLQELRGANTQMEMAAECIDAGRYDEALLHVRSMSRSRRAAIAAATGEQP